MSSASSAALGLGIADRHDAEHRDEGTRVGLAPIRRAGSGLLLGKRLGESQKVYSVVSMPAGVIPNIVWDVTP